MIARAERAEKERERRTEELAPLQKEAAVFAGSNNYGQCDIS